MFEAIIEGYRWFFLRLADVVGLGWGIVALSFITSVAMMPLMKAVAGVVRRETEYQSVILPQIADINKRYATDIERNLHIQRLYACYSYSPLSAVKKVLPLFVQIPFLLLTYAMLKGTTQLSGVSFLFLRDLGMPDALAHGLNLLPFAMTGVNLVTVFASPGFTRRDQTQAIGIGLLFLVMLYAAPSALLLYWTLNNIFTFVRTLCEKDFAGARLFIYRLRRIKSFPTALSRFMTPRKWAVLSMILFVLAVYFCLTARLTMGVVEGLVCGVTYRRMTTIIALASISSFMLLFHDKTTNRSLLIVCTSAIVGFSLFFEVLSQFPMAVLMRFYEVANLFYCTYALIAIWMMPYLFQSDGGFVEVCRLALRALKHNMCLLLLPLIFSIHYAFSSEVFTLPLNSILLLCLYLSALPMILDLMLTLLFRKWISPSILIKIAFGICAGIYIMPMLGYGNGLLGSNNNIHVRLIALALIVLVLLKSRNSRPLSVFMTLLLCVTIANSFLNHRPEVVDASQNAVSYEERMRSIVGEAKCVRSNNVYFVIYDSYAHQTVMDGLGLQGDDMNRVLREHGFTVYDAYSRGADTIASMARAFEIGGVSGGSPCATMAGDNVFCDFLMSAGYRTSYLMCGYTMPRRGERMPGSFYYPKASEITRPELVLFPCILRGSLSQSPQVFNSYTQEDWLSEYHNLVSKFAPYGNFVYAHSSSPKHANWFPRDRKSDKEEQLDYKERLNGANREILDNLKLLSSDPNAIIIFASDHGASMLIPDVSGNWDARHLADHFGILLAIRWPNDYHPCIRLNCLQNVLLEVMIYLSDDRSLARFADSGETVELGYPIGVPAGAIKNGIIQIGPDAGRLFSAAAKDAFERNMN